MHRASGDLVGDGRVGADSDRSGTLRGRMAGTKEKGTSRQGRNINIESARNRVCRALARFSLRRTRFAFGFCDNFHLGLLGRRESAKVGVRRK